MAKTIQEKFEEFDRLNPDVYEELVVMTHKWFVKTGGARVGIEMFFAVMRWERAMKTHDPNSDFKLNNNYTSRYARKLVAEFPQWAGVFETRVLKAV